ncbi:MAG TPA: tRNA (adenosine(37)-N6)-dimethylallyltransferase MiaA [Actinomycetota bacterium]|nr:tRNA (adenosine(37)-N6)-dimethylallyltransferase MiaA [Actinomycetota bacterium]
MTTTVAPRRAVAEAAAVSVARALVGPTATGKTEASIELARRLGSEIVLIDSTTVYRGMDVGTAKPSPEQRAAVVHHLVDVADPLEAFSVAEFQRLAREALRDIASRGRAAILVGGSGLYYRAIVDDLDFPGRDARVRSSLEAEAAALGTEALYARLVHLDPAAAAKIERGNVRRIVRALEVPAITGRPFSSYADAWDRYPSDHVRAAGVAMRPDTLRRRIEARTRAQLDGALVEEVRALLDGGFRPFLTSSQAIGYLEVAEHLAGRLSLEEAYERIVRRTRNLARRQIAWFRRDPRITWFETDEDGAAAIVDELEEWFSR